MAAAAAGRGMEVVSARDAAAAVAVDWVRKARRSSVLIERAVVRAVVVGVGARKAWLLERVARRAATASFILIDYLMILLLMSNMDGIAVGGRQLSMIYLALRPET